MHVEIIEQPAEEPISLDDAKLHLSLDSVGDAAEDAKIDLAVSRVIRTAREYVETYTRRKLITQTLRLTGSGFGSVVRLDFAPAIDVVSVKYKSQSDGELVTLAADQYQLVKSLGVPFIAPRYMRTWPVPLADWDSVVIEVRAGYGAASDVPLDMVQAMYLLLSHFYDNRNEEIVGMASSKLSLGADRLLGPHILHI